MLFKDIHTYFQHLSNNSLYFFCTSLGAMWMMRCCQILPLLFVSKRIEKCANIAALWNFHRVNNKFWNFISTVSSLWKDHLFPFATLNVLFELRIVNRIWGTRRNGFHLLITMELHILVFLRMFPFYLLFLCKQVDAGMDVVWCWHLQESWIFWVFFYLLCLFHVMLKVIVD